MFTRHTTLLAPLVLGMVLAPALFTSAAEQVTHVIRDEFGFETPKDAMKVTLPKGWQVKGAVQWYGRPGCHMEPMKLHFMATATDGKQWVEFIPGGVWGWSSSFDAMPQMAQQGLAGCDARPIRDVRTFVDQYIPTIRPGATISAMRLRPDQAGEVLKTLGDLNLQPGQRSRMEVMEVRLNYEANGHQVNELLMPAVLFIDQPALDMYGGMNGYTTVALAVGTVVIAAVDGTVDESLLDLVVGGMRYEPDYMARLEQRYQHKSLLQQQAGQRRRAAQQAYLASRRAAANSQVDTTGSDILDIQMETYKNTSAMRDAGQARAVDGIHERKPWLNSSGQTVYMPQQYQRAYQLPNGVYTGTNDTFFNPVQTFGQFADPMREEGY